MAEAGEVHWVDLDPVLGSEQGGRRPVLILSEDTLHRMSSRVLICPITSNLQPWPTKVLIPPGCVVSGALLTDQARMIDRSRPLRYIGRLPDAILLRVRHRLVAYMGVVPTVGTEAP
ncbi:MAG: MazF family transcriptional regulator [Chelatococcus sp.]|nr:MAG: MazF family transcriptional regulator [Chelatococcus sp.]